MRAGDEDAAPRRSRAAEKRERESNETALAELVQRLCALSPGQLEAVGAPEPVLAALHEAKRISGRSARDRHLRHLRVLLRDAEWQPLLRRVDLVRGGMPVGADDATAPVPAWATRLVIHGDPALQQFLEQFPGADRDRLRRFVQNVQRAPEGRRAKARRLLEAHLHNVLQRAADERAT